MDPIIAFLLGVAVTVAGWLILHQLNRQRDREGRQHAERLAAETSKVNRGAHFLRFMAQWRSEVEQSRPDVIWSQFRAKLHLFRVESWAIAGDFTIDQYFEFLSLIGTLGDLGELGENEIEHEPPQNGRTVIGEAIDAVVRFVEAM